MSTFFERASVLKIPVFPMSTICASQLPFEGTSIIFVAVMIFAIRKILHKELLVSLKEARNTLE